MYFSIDYKFVFVYKASLPSREVGGGSNPLRGPSMSGSKLHESGDIYSPGGQSTACGAGSQQGRFGSQQFQGGEDANKPRLGFHQFQYFFY